MEKIIVEICICTECVMHGAMDLMESVENLTEIFQHEDNDFEQREIEIITNKCIGEPKHSHECPKIKINDQVYIKAKSQNIMSAVLASK